VACTFLADHLVSWLHAALNCPRQDAVYDRCRYAICAANCAAGKMDAMPHDKIKAAARQRMPATGEAYTEARRMVIAEQHAEASSPLFPEPDVPHDGPLGWAEPSVNFMLESTRQVAVAGRMNVNACTHASRTVTESSGHGSRAAGAPIMK